MINKPSRSRVVLGSEKPALSNRGRRLAKKCFRKSTQAPVGWHLQYRISTQIDANPTLPVSVRKQQELLDEVAMKLYKKSYFKLPTPKQYGVLTAMHDPHFNDKVLRVKDQWAAVNGRHISREELN